MQGQQNPCAGGTPVCRSCGFQPAFQALLAFYDFPAEHWVHIRTTNPNESTLATDRLRTRRRRNCGSRDTTLAMVFKLLQSAQKRWIRIKGFRKLELVINNVPFQDGEQVTDQSDRKAA